MLLIQRTFNDSVTTADILRSGHVQYEGPFNVHIDPQGILCPRLGSHSAARLRLLPPRAAATLKCHPSNQVNLITKEEHLMHDS